MKYILTLLSYLVTTLFAINSVAESAVWKVSHGDKHLYIGGTVHLLTQADYPLPEEFEYAYADSNTLYFETDIQKSATPEFSALMLKKLSLNNGETLKQKLSPTTYKAFTELLSKKGLPLQPFLHFTPSGAAIMVSMMEYLHQGFKPELGVDSKYTQQAISDNKTIGSLESVEEQLEFLVNMSGGKDDDLILYTIRDIERFQNDIAQLKDAWRKGDLNKMNEIALEELKDKFPASYQSIIVTRNNNWIKKITPMFKTKEKEFILVGALHLVGKEGLLYQLDQAGYKVEQL